MPQRIHLEIPSELVADYEAGRVTVAKIACSLGVSEHVVLRELRSLGADTSMQRRKRLKFLNHVEATMHLEPGTASTTIMYLYGQGLSSLTISHRLQMNPRTVQLILDRNGVGLRSAWGRSVFERHPEAMKFFAQQLRSLREALGLTQKSLGARCGLSPTTISNLENMHFGLHWYTFKKLVQALEVRPESLGVHWGPPWNDGDDKAGIGENDGPSKDLTWQSQAAEPMELATTMTWDGGGPD